MDILNEIRTHHEDLADQILATAQDISKPYCYHCAALAIPTKRGIRCPTCFSDDLARIVDGVGCDWGLCRIRHKPHYAEHKIMLSTI